MNPKPNDYAGVADQAIGDCFKVAGDLILGDVPKSLRARLIHAEVAGQGPLAGLRLDHAWVEIDVDGSLWAVDHSNGRTVTLPAALYRSIGQASRVRNYHREDAIGLMIETGHYGPWTDQEDQNRG